MKRQMVSLAMLVALSAGVAAAQVDPRTRAAFRRLPLTEEELAAIAGNVAPYLP
jgi:hypothetical protein